MDTDLACDDSVHQNDEHHTETIPRPNRVGTTNGQPSTKRVPPPKPMFEHRSQTVARKDTCVSTVPLTVDQGSPHDNSTSVSSSSDADHGRKTRKRKRCSSNCSRESDDRNKMKKDLRIELMEQEIKLYTRLNRDYDKSQRLLQSVAGQLGCIKSFLESKL